MVPAFNLPALDKILDQLTAKPHATSTILAQCSMRRCVKASSLLITQCRAANPIDLATGVVLMASLIPVSACQEVSGLRTASCLLAFLLQIIQQLPEHEHPESTDMGVHSASLGQFGSSVGSIQRVIRG
jgi:hypothetical protein